MPQDGRGSANKPFITEYKLAFKDPTPFLRKGTQPGAKKKAAKQQQLLKDKQQQQQQQQLLLQQQQFYEQQNLKQLNQTVKLVFPFASNAGIKEAKLGQPGNGPVSKKDLLWGPRGTSQDAAATSLTLPAMLSTPIAQPNTFRRRRVLAQQNFSTQRYNIISGTEIQGEPYSGYKEGRRAVIQTFARIDLTTNARTPGYNIISNKDNGLDEEELMQKLVIQE